MSSRTPAWRRRRRRRIAIRVLLVLVVAGLLGPPVTRELARRRIEALLTRTLGGPVSVRAVESLRPRSLVLRELRGRQLSRVPFVESLRAERVELRMPAAWWRAPQAPLDLRVSGLLLVVPTAEGVPPVPPALGEGLRWPEARLVLEDSAVRFLAGDRVAELRLRALGSSDARGPVGVVRFTALRLPVGPVAAVGSLPEWLGMVEEHLVLHAVAGELRLGAGQVRVSARAGSGRLELEPEALPVGAVTARAELGFDGAGRIEFGAESPWSERLAAVVLREPGRGWRPLSGEALGVDAPLLGLLHPWLAEWSLSGEADVRIVPTPGEAPVELALAVRLDEAAAPAAGGKLLAREAELAGRLVFSEPRRVEAARVQVAGWRWADESFGAIAGEGWKLRAEGLLDEDSSSTWTALAAEGRSLAIDTHDGIRIGASALRLEGPRVRLELGDEARLHGDALAASARTIRAGEASAWSGELRDSSWTLSGAVPVSHGDGPLRLQAVGAAGALGLQVGAATPPAVRLRSARLRLERSVAAGPLALELDASFGRDWGRFEAEGRVRPELALDWRWRPSSASALLGDWLGDSAPPVEAEALSLKGRLDARGLRATAAARGWEWRPSEGLSFAGEALTAELILAGEGSDPRFVVPEAAAELRAGEEPRVVPLRAAVRGRWRLGGAMPGPLVEGLDVTTEGLGTWTGRADLAAGTGEAEWSGGSLAAWSELLLAEPPEWWPARLEGELSGPLSWRSGPDGSVEVGGRVALRGGGFESEDGERVAVGARGDFRAAARWRPEDRRLELSADSDDFGGFELVWGTLYGDWSQQRAALSLRVETAEGLGGIESLAIELRPDEASRVAWSLAPQRGAWSLSARLPQLQRTWPAWVRDRLQGLGALSELELAGAAELELEGREESGVRELRGLASLEDVAASLPSRRLGVARLDLQLPVDLRRDSDAPGPAWSGPRSEGLLRVGRVALRGFETQPLVAPFVVQGDAARLEGELVAPLFGGRAVLGELRMADLLTDEPRLTGRLRLDGLDLGLASTELGLPPAEGRLEADFGEAVLTPARLSLTGLASARVLGGLAELTALSVEEPFGPLPETRLSLKLSELDLEQLTGQVGFGKVTGRLDGSITDLVMQGARPVRFDARFRTVRRKGVPRIISVEAAEDITALGSGSSGDVFERGFLRFFDRFEYDRAGFEVALRHGVVQLRGTERRGRRELFVRGGFPLWLDVVNADPGRLLSFQGLLERVNDLGLEDVRIQRGRPDEAVRREP